MQTPLLTPTVERTPKIVTALAAFSLAARYQQDPQDVLMETWGRFYERKMVLHCPPSPDLFTTDNTWLDPHLFRITPKCVFVAMLAPRLRGVSVERVLLHVWNGLINHQGLQLPDPATVLSRGGLPTLGPRMMDMIFGLGDLNLLQVENLCVQIVEQTRSPAAEAVRSFFLEYGEPRLGKQFSLSQEGNALVEQINFDAHRGHMLLINLLKAFQHYLVDDLEHHFLEIWPCDQLELNELPPKFGPLPGPADVVLDLIL